MPIQAPQWTDYLNCPACCREFAPRRSPVSLGCGHTLCKLCLKNLLRKQCPFDQTVISVNPEELVVNTALLQLAGYNPPAQPFHPPAIQALPEVDRRAYDVIVKCQEQLAVFLKYCGNASVNQMGSRLSRPMQRKLVTLLQCAMMDEEGRGKAARAARSLGERTVTELILQHQNPQQLSANLWAAVRARGCQFLGPAMQEEVLKLVLLALEDGSALSRKVLVMFVVQRLEPHFPQASKTSIGHVVQLLYRASCFKVSKRESDSSLMQLKEEFRTYETLRREHDAQIVQIATEAGLRIAPDQWSALLYGDTQHKSHMQSIIDKLQTPQSFAQSVQELFIALQRTGDPAQLIVMSIPLDRLATIDASPDAKSPNWQQLSEIMTSLKEVVSGLVHYMQHQSSGRDANHNAKTERSPDASSQSGTSMASLLPGRYKVSMCRDAQTRTYCPRGQNCTYAHSEEELERYRGVVPGGAHPFMMPGIPPPMSVPRPMHPFPRFSVPPPPLPNIDSINNFPPMQHSPSARRALAPDLERNPFEREHRNHSEFERRFEHPPYKQPFDHQMYDHQPFDHPPFDHPPFDHQRPNADNYMGSYANALMQGGCEGFPTHHQNGLNTMNGIPHMNGSLGSNMNGMGPSNSLNGLGPSSSMNGLGNNPINGLNSASIHQSALKPGLGAGHMNGGLNNMNGGLSPHGLNRMPSTSRFPRYMSERASFPFSPQLNGGRLNEDIGPYPGIGPIGSEANHPDFSPHQPTTSDHGFDNFNAGPDPPFEPFGLGGPRTLSQDSTWAPPASGSPFYKFNSMAKNLPIGIDINNGLPIGIDLSSNGSAPLMDLHNVPIGARDPVPISGSLDRDVQNMPFTGVPIAGTSTIGQSKLASARQRPSNKKADQVLEKELQALQERITTEFSDSETDGTAEEENVDAKPNNSPSPSLLQM